MSCLGPLSCPLESWLWLGCKIRLALFPDSPQLIDNFMRQGNLLVRSGTLDAWKASEYQFAVLIQSCRSPALPWHWRRLCLDQAHRPLKELSRLVANIEEHRRLEKLSFHLACIVLPPEPAGPRSDSPMI